MPHPEMDLLSEFKKTGHNSIQPVYPSTEKLAKRNITNRVMRQLVQTVFEEIGYNFTENLPDTILTAMNLISKQEAMCNIIFLPTNPCLPSLYTIEI